MIELERASLDLGSNRVVNELSLIAERGQVLALVGPNGAGKSSALRLMSGELQPTSGSVRFAGRALGDWDLRELARRRALLSQRSELTFPFRCREVVMLGRAPHFSGRESASDQRIVHLAMTSTDTLALADRTYPTLSGGEKQRVDAARVLAQIWDGTDGRALLLDEPTASLDLAHQHLLLGHARSLARERCAVVCVLHDLNLAAQYADVVAVLDRGKLRALGVPSEVLDEALLAEVFQVEAELVTRPGLERPLIVIKGARASRATPPSQRKEAIHDA